MRKKLFVICVVAIAVVLLLNACAGVDLTLTFEVDGEVYATVNTMGQETVKMPKDPEKEGYIFDGWYWDKDVWEKPFTANSLLETPLSENMIVYAKWKLKAETQEHVYDEWEVVTPATCTGEGLQKHTCTVCGEEETEAIPKLAHNYGEWTVVTPATCIAEGLQKRVCSVCEEEESEVIPTVPHTYGKWEIVTPATCTAEGLQKHACTVCGEEETEAIPKLAHNYGEWTVVTPATCTAEGLQKHVCTICGEEETEVIPTVRHTYGEWTVVTPVTCIAEGLQKHTCTVCGEEETEVIQKLPHTYETRHDAANHWSECSVCHETVNFTGHTFGEWIAVIPASCTAEGLQKRECACGAEETEIIPILAHNYETKYDAEQHWQECSVCHEKISETAHSFGEWSVVTAATCATEGLQKRECACGAEETEVNQKLPHTYGEWEVVTDATCTVAGRKKRVCTVCNEEETEAIPTIAHAYETKHDQTNHWEECWVCHEKINVTAHAFGDWEVITSANCTVEGLQKRTCSVCGTEETAVISKLPHTYGEWTEVTPATCTVEGQKKRTCSVCGTEEMEAIPKVQHIYETKTDETNHWQECSVCHEKINVTAHAFGDWEVINRATCTTEGQQKRICSCGEVKTAVTEKLAHTYGAWEVLTAATCSAEGLEKRICSVCGEVHTEVIKKLPHSYEIKHDTANHWEECAVCNEKINETAHTYGEWEVVTAASCTMEGEKKRVCTVCSSVHTEAIPIVPHTYATKHDEANHWEECSVCQDKINETAHTFGDWSVVTPATCTVEGLQKRTCSVCGTEQTEAIQKLPHTYETKFDATNHWQECSVCGETSNQEAHTYENGICTVCQRVYGTEGLAYRKITNGYAVSGIGSAGNNAEIIIPSWHEREPVTAIDSEAFYQCYNLQSIAIPEGVTTIGERAFYGCSYLMSIAIPDSVTSIGDNAFERCNRLTSIAIPDSVTSIGKRAFYRCSSLQNITIPFVGATKDGTSKTHFGYLFGATSYSENKAYVPSSLKEVIITGGTSIGDRAFYGCSSLTSIKIPDSVTSIGDYVFYECSSLTSINIPNSVTSIGRQAFSIDCIKLVIYAEAAAKPSGWNSNWNYSNCPVVWDYKNNDVADDGYIYTVQNGVRYALKDGAAVVKSQPSNIIEANIASKIVYKETNYSVTSIGDRAFAWCDSLTSITIPDSVTSIGSSAFYGCSNLTSIAIPDSVTSIGDRAFWGCSSLTSIAIPKSVTSIGDFAFNECSGLETITVAEGNTKYHSAGNCLIETATKTLIAGCKNSIIPTDGSVTSIGNSAFSGCISLTSIAIPDSVTSIGGSAFYRCSSLTSVVIPNGVTSIGSSAFWECSSLQSIAIPNSVTSIGSSAFYGTGIWNNTADNSVVYADKWAVGYKGTISEVTLKADTVGIGSYAFEDCSSLLSIAIPDSVTSIGFQAFSYCSNLTSIKIGNGVTSIGYQVFEGTRIWNNTADNSVVYADKWAVGYKGDKTLVEALTLKADTVGIGDRAFSGCNSLTSIEIPNSVTSIGDYAFQYCRGLTSITIPDSVTSIGNQAFDGCSSLTSIVIGNSVTSIGSYAFQNCSSLTSIAIPNGVTSIADGAFSGCSSLTSIAIGNSVTSIGYRAFYGCSSLTNIAIPQSVTSIGSDAFAYCSRLTSIEYQGTKAEWKAITKGSNWNDYTGNYTVTCTDGTLSKAES